MAFNTSIPAPALVALRTAATTPGLRFKENDPNKGGLLVATALLNAGLVSRTGPAGVISFKATPAGITELARLDALA